jgi:hypothetical protein
MSLHDQRETHYTYVDSSNHQREQLCACRDSVKLQVGLIKIRSKNISVPSASSEYNRLAMLKQQYMYSA